MCVCVCLWGSQELKDSKGRKGPKNVKMFQNIANFPQVVFKGLKQSNDFKRPRVFRRGCADFKWIQMVFLSVGGVWGVGGSGGGWGGSKRFKMRPQSYAF